MPVFVGNDVVKYEHPIQRRHDVRCAQRLAAVDEMLIDGRAVVFLLRLHDAPRADKLRISRNEIFAYAIRFTVFPDDVIRDMIYTEPVHDLRGNYFVKRLLTKRIASALDKAAFPVYDFPTLFQVTVRRIIGRIKIECSDVAFLPKQHISYIFGECIFKKIQIIPIDI